VKDPVRLLPESRGSPEGSTAPILLPVEPAQADIPSYQSCGCPRTALTRNSLRCTKQRLDVYETLAATKLHPTPEQLHRMVSERSPGISLATVYNTLEALCEAGLAHRIPTPAGCRYDADTTQHVHVVLPDGRLLDVPAHLGDTLLDRLSPALQQELADALGVNIKHIAIQLHAAPETT